MNSCFFMDILVVYNNHICNALINSFVVCICVTCKIRNVTKNEKDVILIKKCVACFKKMY